MPFTERNSQAAWMPELALDFAQRFKKVAIVKD
jgi:hypothetical protein